MDNIIINIDSRFRNKQVYTNSGKFVHNLSEPIKNCKYIRLSSIEFPNLYFTFTEKKQNISFKITQGVKTYQLTIEEGYYSSDTLLTEIQAQLDKANTFFPANFDIEFNYNNGFITISDDNDFTIDFSNGDSRYSSLGYQLGFRQDTYTSESMVISGSAKKGITSESQLDTIGDNYLFLKINDYGVIYHDFEDILIKDNLGKIIERQKYVGNKNVFAKIIINSNKGEQVFDNGSNFLTKSFVFRQPIDLNKFSIELTDPKGNTVEMVHMDYSFTLEVGVIYDLSLTYEATDIMTNKFLLNGLPNLPSMDKLRKNNHSLNITNEMANQSENLNNYKIINNDNFVEENLAHDLETLNALFETVNDTDSTSKKSKDSKDKEKKKKKKAYKFNY